MTDLSEFLPTSGATVDLVSFDYQCHLLFRDGPVIALAAAFRLVTVDAEHLVAPEDPATVFPLLGVLHDQLRAATVSEHGELSLAFASGIVVYAPALGQSEAWEIVHNDGRMVIALPDGDVAVFPAHSWGETSSN